MSQMTTGTANSSKVPVETLVDKLAGWLATIGTANSSQGPIETVSVETVDARHHSDSPDSYTGTGSQTTGIPTMRRYPIFWGRDVACPENPKLTISDIIHDSFPEILALAPDLARNIHAITTDIEDLNNQIHYLFPEDPKFLALLARLESLAHPESEAFLMHVLEHANSQKILKSVLSTLLKLAPASFDKYLHDKLPANRNEYLDSQPGPDNPFLILLTKFIVEKIPADIKHGQGVSILLTVLQYLEFLNKNPVAPDTEIQLHLRTLTQDLESKIKAALPDLSRQQLEELANNTLCDFDFGKQIQRKAAVLVGELAGREQSLISSKIQKIRDLAKAKKTVEALEMIVTVLDNDQVSDLNKKFVLDEFEAIAKDPGNNITHTVSTLYSRTTDAGLKQYLIKFLFKRKDTAEAAALLTDYFESMPLPVKPDDNFLELLEMARAIGLEEDVKTLLTKTLIDTFSFTIWEQNWKAIALMHGLQDEVVEIYSKNLLQDSSCIDQLDKLKELERTGSPEQIRLSYLAIATEGLAHGRNSKNTLQYVIGRILELPPSSHSKVLYKAALSSGGSSLEQSKTLITALVEGDSPDSFIRSTLLNLIRNESNPDELEKLVLFATNIIYDANFSADIQAEMDQKSTLVFEFKDYFEFMSFLEERIRFNNYEWINFALKKSSIQQGSIVYLSPDPILKTLFRNIATHCDGEAKKKFVQHSLIHTDQEPHAYLLFSALIENGFLSEIIEILPALKEIPLSKFGLGLENQEDWTRITSLLKEKTIRAQGPDIRQQLVKVLLLKAIEIFEPSQRLRGFGGTRFEDWRQRVSFLNARDHEGRDFLIENIYLMYLPHLRATTYPYYDSRDSMATTLCLPYVYYNRFETRGNNDQITVNDHFYDFMKYLKNFSRDGTLREIRLKFEHELSLYLSKWSHVMYGGYQYPLEDYLKY